LPHAIAAAPSMDAKRSRHKPSAISSERFTSAKARCQPSAKELAQFCHGTRALFSLDSGDASRMARLVERAKSRERQGARAAPALTPPCHRVTVR
jgi:hypothetical protein